MATVVRASIRDILNTIRQRLVDYPVIGTDRVYIVARRNVPHFQADQDILIRALGFTVDRGWADGAGRKATRIDRQVAIIPRTRLATDEADRDPQWLNHASLGHYQLEEKIPDALEEPWFPAAANGDHLTIEPIRMLSGSEADKGEMKGEDFDWGDSAIFYKVSYLLALTQ